MPLLHRALRPLAPSRLFSSTAAARMARTTILGRLVAPPEETGTSTGRTLIRYSIASESGPKDNRVVSFFRVASFAENKQKDYLLGIPKGTLVYVEADTRLRLAEDAEGKKVPRLDMVQRKWRLPHGGGARVLMRCRHPGGVEQTQGP